jgi:hypothetical protein
MAFHALINLSAQCVPADQQHALDSRAAIDQTRPYPMHFAGQAGIVCGKDGQACRKVSKFVSNGCARMKINQYKSI